MVSVKILVTYKNKHKVLKSDIITPIQTGRAIADEIFEDMIGDDTGDNISKDNPKYNELSAQYWAWKNYDKLGNPDYIGFMHYRRHFLFNNEKVRPLERWLPNSSWYLFESVDDEYKEYLNDEDIKNTVKGYDCIIPHIYDYTNYFHKNLVEDFKNLLDQKIEHFHLMIDTVKKLFPDYAETAEDIRNGHEKYIANMFIMKKEMFNEYCNFLFSIESEIDKKVNSKYFSENESRFLGFLGEILLTIFIKQKQKEKKYKIKEIDTSFILNTRIEDDFIYPFFEGKGIAIAMASSNEYVPYLSVLLQSLILHSNKNNKYDIIVFERDITTENKEKLLRQVLRDNISLRFISPENLFKNIQLPVACKYFKKECYYRLAAPLVLQGYEKIIFTDIDLVFCQDIAQLWGEKIPNGILAGVQDAIMSGYVHKSKEFEETYIKNKLKMKESYMYINTGVLIFNTKKYIKENLFNRLIQIIMKNNFMLQEQDAINSLLSNHIHFLPLKYNYTPYNSTWKKDNVLEYMPNNLKKEYIEASKNPVVIHYAGGDTKPWYKITEKDAGIWWKYARQSPFYEEILLRLMNNQEIKIESYDIDIIKKSIKYTKIKIKYLYYKVLSKISIGKKRKIYKIKKETLKQSLKQIKQFLGK